MGKGPKAPPAPPTPPPVPEVIRESDISSDKESVDYLRKRKRGFNYSNTLLSGGGALSPAQQAPKTLLGQ
ncbi:MAG: hypothetical protein RR506_06540 [Akkermansia sp.]